jgi:hypothetical protein
MANGLSCATCYQPSTGKKRAGNGTRTHNLLLGKEAFYQLNYTRNCRYSVFLLTTAYILACFFGEVNLSI